MKTGVFALCLICATVTAWSLPNSSRHSFFPAITRDVKGFPVYDGLSPQQAFQLSHGQITNYITFPGSSPTDRVMLAAIPQMKLTGHTAHTVVVEITTKYYGKCLVHGLAVGKEVLVMDTDITNQAFGGGISYYPPGSRFLLTGKGRQWFRSAPGGPDKSYWAIGPPPYICLRSGNATADVGGSWVPLKHPVGWLHGNSPAGPQGTAGTHILTLNDLARIFHRVDAERGFYQPTTIQKYKVFHQYPVGWTRASP